MIENPFTDITARNWFGDKIRTSKHHFYYPFSGYLVILGSEPFINSEFAKYLATKHGLICVTDKLAFNGKEEEAAHEGFVCVTPNDPNRDLNLLIVVGKNLVESSLLESLVLQKTYIHNHVIDSPFWVEFNEFNGKPVLLRSPSHLNYDIISQEMLLSRLFLGEKLYVENENDDYLKSHSNTHPVLNSHHDFKAKIENLVDAERSKYEEEYFRWPSTQIGNNIGNEIVLSHKWPKTGVLKHLGYEVGIHKVPTEIRRQILSDAYTSNTLPYVKDQAHMNEWGNSGSLLRLKKMAYTIAQLTQNKKRDTLSTGNNNDEAINDWENDLDWSKQNFYLGKYDYEFKWPETEIE